MAVGGGGRLQQLLQEDLAAGGVQQVGAAHDVGDPLPGVVHHHGQLVGIQAILALDHEIGDFRTQRDIPDPLQAVDKADAAIGGN